MSMRTLLTTITKFGNRVARISSDEARALAIIAASMVVIIALVMLISYQRGVAEDPLRVSELKTLRDQLHLAPKDEALMTRIRALDVQQRDRYFTRVNRNEIGAWFLAGGTVVFVWAASRWFSARKRPFLPRALTPMVEVNRNNSRARYAIAGVSGVVVIASAIIGVTQRVQLTAAPKSPIMAGAVPDGGVTLETMRQNWPQFRGADAGLSTLTNIPAKWDIATGENIAWKITPPVPGVSSPVVWSNRLFLTAADKASREVLCFDTANGALLWRLPAKLATAEAVVKMEIPELTGAAISTPAADAQRVFAIFATGELIAADHSGRLVWSKNFGKPENPYGHATSLAIWRDKLIVQLDQGDHEANKSKLYAFDVATGKVAWEAARPHIGASWGTPITFNSGGRDQLVCVGVPDVISYDPATGRELWKCKGFDGEMCPSPGFAAGFVFAMIPSQQLFAIRADGSGDVTSTHIMWKTNTAVPDITSPISNGELLFTMETYGMLTCYDAKSGAKVWDHQYEGEFQASPTIAGDKLFLFTTEGDGICLRVGKKFEELGRSKFGEAIKATPAFVGERMFVRGATNLFCMMAKGATK